ncbi:abscisic acid 8'-hydroxylase 4-like isoform X2 [Solanum tuberosum]|uniref:abscisic acid 8'-hydroxylase 4-like isoform X2 n=1 Tax=Solanum tuberosum TaxID=4113 RepID=UPI00073A4F06|nr:PREDICTED: abscisic acid 8'-hydroxylase 4-like isoform X2 [Solanum tuberosum]
MENISCSILYVLLFLIALLLYYHISLKKSKWRNLQKAKLPPGSMGWPYIGETLQLYSQDPSVFFASKQKRYGDIFKTHILGYPCVMLASPEAARFVLVTYAHLFKPTYPKSKERLIGPSALFFHQGNYHSRLRKLVQSLLAPEALRKLITDIEDLAISSLELWAEKNQTINTFSVMKKFSFEVGILAIFGHLDAKYKEELNKNYSIVEKGYNSFPTNLPGTAYYKAMVARRKLNQILREIISERKEKKTVEKDLLCHLLNFKDEKGKNLTEDQIADNVIGVLFAAQDTTASALTWILKYLSDDQKLLETVKAEQRTIYESNGGKKPLTWAQTRNMSLTYRVILESLRMSSIISFTFREAVADVEYDGYLIPKGWKVMPLFRNIHHNPEFFADPQNFDASRFEVAPKPNTYMPFGNGAHACPGNELAKLEMLILIHHLVTKFRFKSLSQQVGNTKASGLVYNNGWEVEVSKGAVQYSPFPIPQHGLPSRFWKETRSQRDP